MYMMHAYSIISYLHVEVTKCVIQNARLYVLSFVTASCILTTHSVFYIKCALGLYNFDSRNNDKTENTDTNLLLLRHLCIYGKRQTKMARHFNMYMYM